MQPGGSRAVRLPGGRKLIASPVFDTYWKFAARRQDIFMRRVRGDAPPWTDDPVLLNFRFTNVYRASDRVSQYLIRNVLYTGSQEPREIFFRCLLFKIFNRIDTWEYLCSRIGTPQWTNFSPKQYSTFLTERMSTGVPIYSAAYIMPSPPFGRDRKHSNHLALLDHMIRDSVHDRIAAATTLRDAFAVLRKYPSLGDFLSFQFVIDLNYSNALAFNESEYVVAGPGARDGIRKCFLDTDGLSDTDILLAIADIAPGEFERLGIDFKTLWGRPLQPIDCQNLFCEVDKYARVVHPDFRGNSKRVRIKQRFTPLSEPLPQWYPPKWRLTPEEFRRSTRVPAIQTTFDFGSH